MADRPSARYGEGIYGDSIYGLLVPKTISGRSATNSRAAIEIISITLFSGTSQTGNRSIITVYSKIGLSGKSATTTRTILGIRLREPIHLGGVSATSTRTNIAVSSSTYMIARTATVSRSRAEPDMLIGLSALRSITDVRTDISLQSKISLSGKSTTTTRADVTLNIVTWVIVLSGEQQESAIYLSWVWEKQYVGGGS